MNILYYGKINLPANKRAQNNPIKKSLIFEFKFTKKELIV